MTAKVQTMLKAVAQELFARLTGETYNNVRQELQNLAQTLQRTYRPMR